ncbi:Uncharacterized protein HZ326_4641 [Fusarium oxysporum f. sp. albedinis]|nr:Uncharacterized protein HZ326_4641 [Fusarium oxysporum f. sp. albedinis]
MAFQDLVAMTMQLNISHRTEISRCASKPARYKSRILLLDQSQPHSLTANGQMRHKGHLSGHSRVQRSRT